MNQGLIHYRRISGIKSLRSNPITINRRARLAQTAAHSTVPVLSKKLSDVERYDKEFAFNYVESRWFRKKLMHGEQIKLTADLLKMICDEVHEMGRLFEKRAAKGK